MTSEKERSIVFDLNGYGTFLEGIQNLLSVRIDTAEMLSVCRITTADDDKIRGQPLIDRCVIRANGPVMRAQ